MAIQVTAKVEVTEGPELKKPGDPYGDAACKGKPEVVDVTMACEDGNAAHKKYRPGRRGEPEEAHAACNCVCRLTGITLRLGFVVRYNPGLIKDCWIDPDPPHKASDKQKPGWLKVDQASVVVHERAHCDFVARKVEEALASALGKIEATLTATCKCSGLSKCKDLLAKQVRQRVEAIANDQWDKLAADASEGKTSSEAERDAREKQVKALKKGP